MTIKSAAKRNIFFELIMIVLVLSVSLAFGVYLIKKRPQPKKRSKQHIPPAVSTITINRQDYSLTMTFQGKARYLKEIDIKSRVSGFITKTDANFIPGGKIKSGDSLLEIDQDDYKNNLLKKISEEKKAENDYLNELGQQEVARMEWELANKNSDLSSLNDELVLRKPSLRLYKSMFDAAKSNTQIARRDLEETIVRAPFNISIKDTFVSQGSFVNSQTVIAKAVSCDSFIIEVSLPWDSLRFFRGINNNIKIKAMVKPLEGVEASAFWPAEFKGLNPSLEETGHLAKISLTVEDIPSENQIPLLGGASVKVLLQDIIIKDVFVVPVEYVHEANQLWLLEDDKLKVYEGKRIWGDEQVVLFSDLPENTRVIKDELARIWPGMSLRDRSVKVSVNEKKADELIKGEKDIATSQRRKIVE